jgi:hypothetical protein
MSTWPKIELSFVSSKIRYLARIPAIIACKFEDQVLVLALKKLFFNFFLN